MGNPQSWNRYAYVTNNPLGFADPEGLGNQCKSAKCPNHGIDLGGFGSGDTTLDGIDNSSGFISTGSIAASWDPFQLLGASYTYNGGSDVSTTIFYDANIIGQSNTQTIWLDNLSLFLLSGSGGSSGGGSTRTGTTKNPCSGFSAATLDYSASKQHIIDDHLAWFQGNLAPSMTSSQYMFEGSINTVDQAWAQIMAFNAYAFTNPDTVSQVGNAYRFTASYPIHGRAAYTGWERKSFPTIFGIPFYSSWRTTDDTVVVQTDCKTVKTSYPGKP